MQRKRLLIVFLALVAGYAGISFFFGMDDHNALIRESLVKFATADTVTGDLRVETIGVFPLGDVSDGEIRIPLAVAGPVAMDLSDPYMPSGHADLTAGLAEENFVDADVHVQWRATDDGASYARFDNLPDFTLGGIDLPRLNGQWFTVTEAKVNAEDGSGGVAMRRGTDIGTVILSAFGPLRTMLADGWFVRSADQMVSEMIDGKPTRHYLLHVDRVDFEELLMESERAAFGRPLNEVEIGKLQEIWDMNDVRIELWIDKGRGEIKRIGFDVRPHLDNPAAVPLRFIMDVSEYGASVHTDGPEGAVMLSDFLKGQEAVPAQ